MREVNWHATHTCSLALAFLAQTPTCSLICKICPPIWDGTEWLHWSLCLESLEWGTSSGLTSEVGHKHSLTNAGSSMILYIWFKENIYFAQQTNVRKCNYWSVPPGLVLFLLLRQGKVWRCLKFPYHNACTFCHLWQMFHRPFHLLCAARDDPFARTMLLMLNAMTWLFSSSWNLEGSSH